MTYPHEAGRTPRKDSILLHHHPFSPPRSAPSPTPRAGREGTGTGPRRAFDVVVETLDDVARARLFEVGGLEAVDGVFERGLYDRPIEGVSVCGENSRSLKGKAKGSTMFLSSRRFFCSVSRRSRRSFS